MQHKQQFYELDSIALDGDRQVTELYRGYKGEKPACLKAAELLLPVCRQHGEIVVITGFVLAPFNKPETDGAIGSVLLTKALAALGAGVTLVCPKKCSVPLSEMLRAIGVNASVRAFDGCDSQGSALELLERLRPEAAIAAECPGRAADRAYYNAAGEDVTALQAKCDLLFELCAKRGVRTVAVGDRGNECGMGSLKKTVRQIVPHGEIIAAESLAQAVLIGRTSEYACYSLAAALVALAKEPRAMFTQGEHIAMFDAALRAGLIDMSGRAIRAVDGIEMERVLAVSREMRRVLAAL